MVRIALLTALTALPLVAQGGSGLDRFIAVQAPTVALINARVIDGTGVPARTGQAILIADGRIRAVGPMGQVTIPRGARIVDLQGNTVIPGLVGLHNHSFYTAAGGRSAQLSYSAPRLYLASGLTTIRTTGARAPYEEINVKRDIDEGRIPGPLMITTGPYITGEEGSASMAHVSGAASARRLVRYWMDEGVEWFKAYTWISREELGAMIEEAHSRGARVTAHLCSVTYREAVALGIDNLEHGLFANTDYDAEKEPDQCPAGFRSNYRTLDMRSAEVQATFREMVAGNVAMTSTLAVYEISVPGRGQVDPRTWDLLAPEISQAVRAEFIRRRDAGPDGGGIHPQVYQRALEFEYAFVQAGGLLAAGVDPTGYGAALPGLGDQRNYELLLEAGFRPEQVIRIMSANGARVLGMFEEIGTIEVGKRADLAVIRGNPLADGHIRNVYLVFRNGVGWDSDALFESVRGVVGIQ